MHQNTDSQLIYHRETKKRKRKKKQTQFACKLWSRWKQYQGRKNLWNTL